MCFMASAIIHETVLFFLQIALPDDLSTQHEETGRQVQEFFQSLEIQAEAAFVDSASLVASTATANPMYKSPNGARPTSAQASDKRMPTGTGSPGPFGPRHGGYDQGRVESTILFSYTYNSSEPGKQMEVRPINGLWTAIFPFSVPVSAPVDDQYNLECFTMVNLLEGLSDDPNFISTAVPQHHYRPDTPRARVQPPVIAPVLRRSARRTIAVRSALNVRMRTTRVSPMENPLMMSIEVENNSEHGAKFKVTQLDVDVTNAVVTPLDSAELTKLPMVLHSVDHVTFLYSISLLDNPGWNADNAALGGSPFGVHSRHSSENLAQSGSQQDSQRQVTIILQGTPEVEGVQGQTIHSRWNCFLDVSDLIKRDNANASGAGTGPLAPSQKHLYAPQPSHAPSALARANDNSLAPVHEGPHHSPVIGNAAASSESGSYEDDGAQQGQQGQLQSSGRPAVNGGGLSPGLGLDLANQALNGVTQGRPEQDNGDGIVVSFAVTDRVVVGKIFNLEIFIVNRSRHIRRYTLVVPNRKRAKGSDPSQGSKVLPPLPSGERAAVQNVPIDPYMEEPELLRRHVDNETTEADIICLENNVRLSPLYPLTCQNLNLRFIAIKEQLHTIDLVQLVDNDTGFVTNLRNCLCFMAEASFGALNQNLTD
ncbi:hypothetical protein BG006_008957 [Podila minutissima]|uniref:Trafficking protein particle complex II-specific subunit 65 IgD3 domain-containing protein n=1 Tax=Podila minutissima TaxID=64525 RepID=A0A9P5VPS4_9FUNG|nr:hypothetical protein BG006_008957 [Podila minutissima]